MTRWFRYYTESLNDPKIQRLPPTVFKVWINCLCLAAQKETAEGVLGTVQDISFALRETVESVSSALHALMAEGLIVTDDETFHVKNWSKRQYKSDSSTDRVKQHRKRFRNVTVTAPDTDTDTDTEKKKRKKRKEEEDQAYAFLGRVIRLTLPDLEKVISAYPTLIDMRAELTAIDAKFTEEGVPPGKWWGRMHAWLKAVHIRNVEAARLREEREGNRQWG